MSVTPTSPPAGPPDEAPLAALLAAEAQRLGLPPGAARALGPLPPWRSRRQLRWGRHTVELGGRTLVLGVVNVTDTSLSGPGHGDDVAAAVAHAEALLAAGADLLDIGGESTRPGAPPVPEAQERARVEAAVGAIAARWPAVPVSVDTRRASVAEAALHAGAGAINDVSGLRHDPALAALAARTGAALILGHWEARASAIATARDDATVVIAAVLAGLRWSVEQALAAGCTSEQLAIDPGLGFGKPPAVSLALLRELAQLRALGLPLVVGPSRKGFIGHVLGPDAQLDWEGTAAAVALAVAAGADIVRVHDVARLVRVVRMSDAIAAATDA
ncbi:MAG TPA: dihydropteroate synthase [Chloroflexota bacterium]|nr:dihydropteroate synthase [Chloroflexota bacterium]